MNFVKRFLMLVAGAWLFAGCAGSNVNSPSARVNTGYVDFYTVAQDDLDWEVSWLDGHTQRYEVIFSELAPPSEGVLRLALPPGRQQLRLTCLNRAVREPCEFEVAVTATMITPAHVVLTDDGVTQVQDSNRNVTISGRTAGDDLVESTLYRIVVVTNTALPYRAKEQMPYAH